MKKKIIFFSIVLLIISITIIVYSGLDPAIINEEDLNSKLNGAKLHSIATDLIFQHIDSTGNIWATAGYSIYFKPYDRNEYRRIKRLNIPFGEELFGHFRYLRNMFNVQESLELMITKEGTIIVFAAGYIYRSADSGRSIQRVHKMENFGRGIGRGIMPQGYTEDAKGNIYWGEYFRNPEREVVRVWKSNNDGIDWKIAYEFKPGSIRHIHSVQYDKISDKIWLTTGDADPECSIGYLDGNEYIIIGEGSKKWVAVSLVFDKDYIYWGTDGKSAEYPENHIVRWSRSKEETEIIATIDSDAFYSAKGDSCYVITTDGKGDGGSIWISRDGLNWEKAISWPEYRDNRHGVIRVTHKEKCTFYITKINLGDGAVKTKKILLN